jgi:hypothetical protein
MLGNPVLFAIIVYGLTIVIALMVSGIIWLIGWAVRAKGAGANKE